MYYKFAQIHKTLTPKASIGVSDHIWTTEEIVKKVSGVAQAFVEYVKI